MSKGAGWNDPKFVLLLDKFEALERYGVLIIPEEECPEKHWFYRNAKLLDYIVALHSCDGVRIVVRLR